jgi:hypothetical protein
MIDTDTAPAFDAYSWSAAGNVAHHSETCFVHFLSVVAHWIEQCVTSLDRRLRAFPK